VQSDVWAVGGDFVRAADGPARAFRGAHAVSKSSPVARSVTRRSSLGIAPDASPKLQQLVDALWLTISRALARRLRDARRAARAVRRSPDRAGERTFATSFAPVAPPRSRPVWLGSLRAAKTLQRACARVVGLVSRAGDGGRGLEVAHPSASPRSGPSAQQRLTSPGDAADTRRRHVAPRLPSLRTPCANCGGAKRRCAEQLGTSRNARNRGGYVVASGELPRKDSPFMTSVALVSIEFLAERRSF